MSIDVKDLVEELRAKGIHATRGDDGEGWRSISMWASDAEVFLNLLTTGPGATTDELAVPIIGPWRFAATPALRFGRFALHVTLSIPDRQLDDVIDRVRSAA